MIPSARRRHALRAFAAVFMAIGAAAIARDAAAISRGAIAHFPTDDAKAGLALAIFAATVASLDLRWTLRARRAGGSMWPLFIDAATTAAAAPVIALFAWAASW